MIEIGDKVRLKYGKKAEATVTEVIPGGFVSTDPRLGLYLPYVQYISVDMLEQWIDPAAEPEGKLLLDNAPAQSKYTD